ncbi:flagellar biosynthetic protein FliR [Nocardioides zeae]
MTLAVPLEPLLATLLASVRIVAWLAVVPPFSTRAVPATAKVLLSLALAGLVAPTIVQQGVPTDGVALLVVVVTQAAIGAAMGFVTYLLFAAVATAGSLIDMFGGFSTAMGFDPLASNTNTVFGTFHQMLATMLLFVTGGHLLVVGGLLRTFELLPSAAPGRTSTGWRRSSCGPSPPSS